VDHSIGPSGQNRLKSSLYECIFDNYGTVFSVPN